MTQLCNGNSQQYISDSVILVLIWNSNNSRNDKICWINLKCYCFLLITTDILAQLWIGNFRPINNSMLFSCFRNSNDRQNNKICTRYWKMTGILILLSYNTLIGPQCYVSRYQGNILFYFCRCNWGAKGELTLMKR